MKTELQFVLLTANHRNLIDSYIKPHYLLYVTLFFIILTLLVLATTFYTLCNKTKKINFNNSIRERVEQWITELLSSEETAEMAVPDDFMELTKNKYARQMIIEELVRSKSSFLGGISDNLVKLYSELGLHIDSRAKLDDKRKHIQCQGIHKLCVMNQKDQLRKIYRLTNSEDNDVRIEAQTAIIQSFGFPGLRFLDMVTFPITEFQQLKLLELLRHLPFAGLPKLGKWLQSSNHTVVNFALKLAEHYNQAQVYNKVSDCLKHDKESVRMQAVKTLAKIGSASSSVSHGKIVSERV